MSEMIYGIHAVQALLERAPERFQEVYILKGREDKRLLPLIHALEAQGVVIQLANRQFLDEKSEGAVHQGIIARVKPGRQYQENDLPDLLAQLDQPFLLILDGVTDPHNLGACLRSADAAERACGDRAKRSFRSVECDGEESGLRRGGERPADPRHQPGAHHASAAGRERLDRRNRRGSRPYAVPEQNDRKPDGAGDGRGRRRHASSDPRTLR